MSRKALVISGGGAKGAWGVGVARALSEKYNKSYDVVIGTSTGSLMGPLILANRFDDLKEGYTTVTQKDIFNKSPFKDNGDIKTFTVLSRLLTKRTLGDSENLRTTIKRFFTKAVYQQIKDENKIFGASVASMTTGKGVVKNINDYSYEDMVNWVWASANNQIFMSSFEYTENGVTESWADGGLKNYVHISYVLENNLADEIDVIVHNTPEFTDVVWDHNSKVVQRLLRVIEIFSADVAKNDIENAKLNIKLENEIPMNTYFMDARDVSAYGNSLAFRKSDMLALYTKGYLSAKNGTINKGECNISCDGSIRPIT